MGDRHTAWARGMRVAAGTVTVIASLAVAAHAAPIGVPAATTGAGKTMIGGEVNVLTDRDLTGNFGEAESSQFLVKGGVGVNDRLDLDFRLGFGDFKADDIGPGIDTDFGPAFGVGMRTTWASIPEANLKIGSVFQTLRIRAEDDPSSNRVGWTEYDAALGAVIDLAGSQDPRQPSPQFGLMPYGGLAWSGLDVDGSAFEDNVFGIFLGLGARAQGNLQFGAEVRLVDQTAISVNAGMTF